ncbi:MAG: hypothetical protein LBK29_00190 [Oscillospiraceae bacterium]|nr:hypothetical protein [Oscillospiraceae bacterium]
MGSLLKKIIEVNKDKPEAMKAIDRILKRVDKSAKREVKPRKVANNDSLTEAKIQKRKELDVWAKNNEPNEGWGLTDKKYVEIKFRKKFLEERPGVSWVEYLESKGLEVKKSTLKPSDDKPKDIKGDEESSSVSRIKKQAKDDSDVLEMKHEKINDDILPVIEKAKLQKRSKDDSELLSMARKLQNVNTKGIKDNKALEYVKRFQNFLKIFKWKIKNNDSAIDSLNKLDNILDIVYSSKKYNIKELNSVINEICEKI